MKQIDSIAGKCYIATAPNGGTVTDESGRTLATVAAGEQKAVWGTDGKLYLSDDDGKLVLATFNYALAALGLLGGGNILPAGYTRLEYLEATGSQTIKMNGLFDKHIGLRLDAETFEGSGNTSCVSFMTQNPSAETYWWVFPPRANRENTSLWEWYWFKKFGSFTGFQLATRYVATINYRSENKVTIEQNGTVEAKELPETLVYSSPELNVINSGWKGRCYSVHVSRNTALENNFIPALTPAGEPCMFDLVSREPYRNAGSGQFIVGMTLAQVRALRLPAGGGELTLSLPHEASIDRLAQAALEQARANGWELTLQYAEAEVPAGYRKLDFLESTGTQYIDTGVKLSNESEVRCEWKLVSRANYNQWLYGRNTKFGAYADTASSSEIPHFYFGGEAVFYYSEGKHAVVHNSKSVTLDGESRYYSEGLIMTEETPAPLFNSSSSSRGFIGRIYSFTISRSGEMQVDYVPCIAPNGALGMYNRVDGIVKENAGSGAFIAGLATVDDVRSLWLPETGGPLTVSVPADTPDSAVEQLRKNNPTWQIAIQYRQ